MQPNLSPLNRFRKKFEKSEPLPDADFFRLADILHEMKFKKGEMILKEGEVCRDFYFVINGCIRSFGLEEGREVNLKFYFEDEIACDFESFREENPSQFYFVAMEKTHVYRVAKTEAVPIFKGSISFINMLFRFFQEAFFKEEEHANNFKLLSPEERYLLLLQQKPHYLQRIPLSILASYLGISRETLTRIRKKIN